MSFELFVEFKKQQNFFQLFENLCQKIALSNITFQQYWETVALPILLEGQFRDENELLLEFDLRSAFGYPSRPATPQPTQIRGPNGEVTKTVDKTNPSYGTGPVKPASTQPNERQQQSNQLAQQLTNQLKQVFTGYLQKFQRQMHHKAFSTNNKHLWKATELFINKINQVVTQFTLNSSPTKQSSYTNDFNGFRKQYGQEQNAI